MNLSLMKRKMAGAPLVLSALLALLTVGGIATQAGRAQAQPAPSRPGGKDFSALGLTPDQKRRVAALHRQINPRLMDLERTLRAQRQAIEDLYHSYDLDLDRARQLNAQMNATQRDILDVHLRLQVELRKILTEDQFNKLRDLMQQRRDARRRPTPPPPPPTPSQH